MDVDLQACLNGEKDAWDAFVHRYARVVFASVRRTMPAGTAADEVQDTVQDVFIRLIRNDYRTLRTFDPSRASLVTWLTLVARTTTIDRLRIKRLETIPLDGIPLAEPEKNDTPDPEIPLHLLTTRQRLVLRLLFDDGMTVSEAARMLDIDEQTVRSTKHKALARLRKHLDEADEKPAIHGDAESPAERTTR